MAAARVGAGQDDALPVMASSPREDGGSDGDDGGESDGDAKDNGGCEGGGDGGESKGRGVMVLVMVSEVIMVKVL